MSWVTNTILQYGHLGPIFLNHVNRFFVESQGYPEGYEGLVTVDDPRLPRGWYGGHKFLECDIAVGALNHVNIEEFAAYIRKLCREDGCGGVQLIVMDQEEDEFHIISIGDVESGEPQAEG